MIFKPEPNNGLVNQFAPHVDPHQPGVMIGWLEEDDDINENVNNEDIEDEDVEMESSNSVSSDSESKDEEIDVAPEVDVAPEATIGTSTQKPYVVRDFPRGVFEEGEPSCAHDSSYVGGLAPWALRR
ncbi:hypothetical protein Tco_0040555, partial [Tanacetum coccineum]